MVAGLIIISKQVRDRHPPHTHHHHTHTRARTHTGWGGPSDGCAPVGASSGIEAACDSSEWGSGFGALIAFGSMKE